MDAPPPYSETDPSEALSIAATTTGSSTSRNPAITNSSDTFIDAIAARPIPSTASSVDDVIYTPLYSPTSSNHAVTDQEHIASSSAAAYFESRPVTNRNDSTPIAHGITVESNTQPQDLLFPSTFQAYGVLESDWLTFVNYILPDYILGVSSDISCRKSGESLEDGVQRLGVDEKRTTTKSSSERRSTSVTSRDRINTTIAEWNDGFFKPRGLQVTLLQADVDIAGGEAREVAQMTREQAPRIPGAWIPYDHEIIGESSAAGRKRGFFGGFKSFQGGSHGKFRMGPIVADNEGFRMGNVFVADQKGLRFGGSKGFVADDSGVSMGGRSFFRRESTDPERGRSGPGGRQGGRNRSSSASSDSSVSSEESSNSDSSVGSLPEYDDLRDQQLPVAKQLLLRWLHQTEHPLTKIAVSQMKRDIQFPRDTPHNHSDQDLAMLRKEVRDLLKEFRENKRKHKRDQRKARRERRALRRAQRTERRIAKKEAHRLRREKRSCKGKEPNKGPPWMTSRSTIDLQQQPPPMPPRPLPDLHPGFPFMRVASAPFTHPPSCGGPSMPHSPSVPPIPGLAVLHSTWPYTRSAPYSPGSISTPPIPGTFPSVVTASSEALYTQAKEMEVLARRKEEEAMYLRTEATRRDFIEKERLKKLDQAEKLEEEAEKWGVEAERLRAEAEALDGELARDLEESTVGGEQVTGVVLGSRF